MRTWQWHLPSPSLALEPLLTNDDDIKKSNDDFTQWAARFTPLDIDDYDHHYDTLGLTGRINNLSSFLGSQMNTSESKTAVTPQLSYLPSTGSGSKVILPSLSSSILPLDDDSSSDSKEDTISLTHASTPKQQQSIAPMLLPSTSPTFATHQISLSMTTASLGSWSLSNEGTRESVTQSHQCSPISVSETSSKLCASFLHNNRGIRRTGRVLLSNFDECDVGIINEHDHCDAFSKSANNNTDVPADPSTNDITLPQPCISDAYVSSLSSSSSLPCCMSSPSPFGTPHRKRKTASTFMEPLDNETDNAHGQGHASLSSSTTISPSKRHHAATGSTACAMVASFCESQNNTNNNAATPTRRQHQLRSPTLFDLWKALATNSSTLL
jgi:hypothetical protein